METTTVLLIFPHQLFAEHPGLALEPDRILLIEDPLFFGDPAYPARFHKQKLAYHRTTMGHFQRQLEESGGIVERAEYQPDANMLSKVIDGLVESGCRKLTVCDVHDYTLERRLRQAALDSGLELNILASPGFLNTPELNQNWRKNNSSWFMASFYKWQRRRLKILVNDSGDPAGGKWSFDDKNRKKVPKNRLGQLPYVPTRKRSDRDDESAHLVEQRWPGNPGNLDTLIYPVTHEKAEQWLDEFLSDRLHLFGDYEDAIVENEPWLWHSVLTPMLNVGLLTPQQIIDKTLDFARHHNVALNSLEGFLRQIIGWREFMRATYDDLGAVMRTTNHWNHTRKLPNCFYDASTGIDPIDDTIRRINEYAYCHHIERLMVLGGFMFLCEIDPDDIYRWFMEMFIDAYDWVMVPNVYAMSQNADGGLITTKPYFSGSAYIRKMSHWKEGEWSKIWDGLYWRFIDKHQESLASNPRWSMMCAQVKKMDKDVLRAHKVRAEAYLNALDARN